MTQPPWPEPPRDPQEYAARLRAAGLGAHVDALVALCRPSVRLLATDDPDPERRRTRLGGRPLLAPGEPWPTRDGGRPLCFVAQVDCAEIADLVPGAGLPADGLLSFFYDALEQPWGFEPADAQGWSVRHHAGVGLQERDFPRGLDPSGRFAALALRPQPEWTFVPDPSFDLERVGMPLYSEAYEQVMGERGAGALTNRLLGHPDPVQSDMQVECQLASNGIACGDGAVDEADERIARLRAGRPTGACCSKSTPNPRPG